MRGAARLIAALFGRVVRPAVAGLSFVPAAALPGPRHDAAADVALALARTCEEAGLDFAFVPAWESWALDAARRLREREIAVAWVVQGVLWPALRATGTDAGLRGASADRGPARQDGPLAHAMDAALVASVGGVAVGTAAGADAIVVADDLAGASGPLVSPAFLLLEVWPRLATLARAATAAGLPAILHCDGDTRTIARDVRAAGFAAVHGDSGGAARLPAALDAAREAGLVLAGGIPTSELASQPAAVRAGAHAAALVAGGGLVLADDGGITTAAEFAALLAALGAARR